MYRNICTYYHTRMIIEIINFDFIKTNCVEFIDRNIKMYV